MNHATRTVSQVGPGGDNSWAACSCGWEGRTRFTRVEASTDAEAHAADCAVREEA